MANKTCTSCQGAGSSNESKIEKCHSCNGSGKAYGYGDPCMRCGGAGQRTISKNNHCYSCGGSGSIYTPDPVKQKRTRKQSNSKSSTSKKSKSDSSFSEIGAILGFFIGGGYMLSQGASEGEALFGGIVSGILLGYTIKLIVWGGLIYFGYQIFLTA